jgi:hypothetical protein
MVVSEAAGRPFRVNPAAFQALIALLGARSRALIGARALIHSCPLALGKAGRLALLVWPTAHLVAFGHGAALKSRAIGSVAAL